MENLKGKTAFITGGASGMGLGIARACAREGMNVVIADFRQNAIDDALAMFKEHGWPCHGICLNVADREAYVRAADEAEARKKAEAEAENARRAADAARNTQEPSPDAAGQPPVQ